MPDVDPQGPFVKRSRIHGTFYQTGAGRLLWGEGLEDKPDKDSVQEVNRKTFKVIARRDS